MGNACIQLTRESLNQDAGHGHHTARQYEANLGNYFKLACNLPSIYCDRVACISDAWCPYLS